MVSEVDPICALQVSTEGHQAVVMEQATSHSDIFVTTAGTMDVITLDHTRAMTHPAILWNPAHFDSEIQVGATLTTLRAQGPSRAEHHQH